MKPIAEADAKKGEHVIEPYLVTVFWEASQGWFYKENMTDAPQGPYRTSCDAYNSAKDNLTATVKEFDRQFASIFGHTP